MHTDYELHERIQQVSGVEADTDRLVTLSLPAGGSLAEARERIQSEHAEAEYIDSDGTDAPVREALERVRRVLGEYEETPANGLVVYAGVVDGEVADWIFDDLPGSVDASVYAQANTFDVGPLEAASSPDATHGLVVVERGGGAIGRFEDGGVEHVETVESGVMGKTRAGGQSADRFERKREEQKEDFFEAVAEAAARAFLPAETTGNATEDVAAADDDERGGEPTVDSLLLGGTDVTVDQFQTGEFLDHRLRERVAGGTFPVEYASEQGLRQLAEKGESHLLSPEERAAHETLDRFFAAVGASGEATDDGGDEGTESDPVVYGHDDVAQAIEFEAVETLLVAESLSIEELGEYEKRVTDIGGEVVVVPADVERGEQFETGFGGVGALLRFPVE
ncbi:Vms1/Ankzf1 family peptidyl-tRNA hydrolase [Halomarina litorea]|uniref:Vms1/Ankzf1 family peptidyl-tRNA hydrolase n=1 Tax=Halomarina litorea TaxID=2961595 RepID=UPI0020C36168|nr:Vms1/Ankzf1 family peptidyl-tRNA hydrolase [Halomarina sp. BCD28]